MGQMRYPDGAAGLCAKTGTRLVTIAVGRDIVFQGGVTPQKQLDMITQVQTAQREWDEVLKLLAEKEAAAEAKKKAEATPSIPGTDGTVPAPSMQEPPAEGNLIPTEPTAHDKKRSKK